MMTASVRASDDSLQSATEWQSPPEELLAVLRAPQLPWVWTAPTGEYLLLADPVLYPPLAELAAPMHKLAGIRVNPAINGRHGRHGSTSPRLVRVEDGATIPLDLPADAGSSGRSSGGVPGTHDLTPRSPLPPGDGVKGMGSGRHSTFFAWGLRRGGRRACALTPSAKAFGVGRSGVARKRRMKNCELRTGGPHSCRRRQKRYTNTSPYSSRVGLQAAWGKGVTLLFHTDGNGTAAQRVSHDVWDIRQRAQTARTHGAGLSPRRWCKPGLCRRSAPAKTRQKQPEPFPASEEFVVFYGLSRPIVRNAGADRE